MLLATDEFLKKGLKVKEYSKIYIRNYIFKMAEKTTQEDNFELFFRRKPAMMLVALKRVTKARYGSMLAKEVDCTYSHAVKILQVLEQIGLVVFEKKGRIKIIKLTKKGNEVASHIETIKDLIE